MNKRELRRYIRSLHRGEAARQAQSKEICCRIIETDTYRQARVIAGYIPLKWEADILPVLEHALYCGKQVVLPRCAEPPHMTLHRISSLDELVPGVYNIPEPPADAPIVPITDADLVLVPLEGIDPAGYRLGKGGGYYDCLLAGQTCATIGCALSWHHVACVPHEPWDVSLSMCASPDGLLTYSTTPDNEGRNTNHGKQEEKAKD